MTPGVEADPRVRADGLVGNDFQLDELGDGRDRAGLAPGQDLLHSVLGQERHPVGAEEGGQPHEIDMVSGVHHGEHLAPVGGADADDLGEGSLAHALGMCRGAGGIGKWMGMQLVGDGVVLEPRHQIGEWARVGALGSHRSSSVACAYRIVRPAVGPPRVPIGPVRWADGSGARRYTW